MPTIKFINEKKEIQVPEGSNLRKEALRAGVGLYKSVDKYLNCRGFGMCGTCRVLITKGVENTKKSINPLGRFRLIASLARIGQEDETRLACQTKVCGDIEVQTRPPLNLFGENFFS